MLRADNGINQKHRQHTQKQTADPEYLHVLGQVEPSAQIGNLSQQAPHLCGAETSCANP